MNIDNLPRDCLEFLCCTCNYLQLGLLPLGSPTLGLFGYASSLTGAFSSAESYSRSCDLQFPLSCVAKWSTNSNI